MFSKSFTDQLSKNSASFKQILSDVSEKQAKWKPEPKKWSILEVVHHLFDEEREDFRKRIDLLLNKPGELWPPIDPEGWVKTRKYNEQDFQQMLHNFLEERNKSIAWLENLQNPNWDAAYNHKIVGKISTGDLLASWVAHDFLHMRQLASLRAEYVEKIAQPYSTRYAMP